MAAIPGTELMAVCDLREHRARITAEKFGAKAHYTDYRKLLERNDLDAVIVATYHPTHASIACEVLRSGRHVLVQKPLATRLEEADKLVKAARSSRCKTMCLPYNWLPAYERAKEIVDSGALGKITLIRSRVAHNGPEKYYASTQALFREEPEECAFFRKEISEGGALFDMGVYAVSAVTGLVGSLVSVTGYVKTLNKPSEVEDTASLIGEMERGGIACMETSWCQVAGQESTAIYGTKGTLYLDVWQGSLSVYLTEPFPGWLKPDVSSAPAQAAHRHFVECILKDLQPRGRPEHARHVVEIMRAGRESEETGKRIALRTKVE